MNLDALRAALQQIKDSTIDALAALDQNGGIAAAPSAPRTPVQVSGVVPPAWSDAIAAMKQSDYLAVLNGAPAPGPVTPLSANQALASYANRPEATDQEYQQIRDGQMRLAKRLPTNVAYGEAIPALMAQIAAEIAADPKPSGFLTGE